MIMLLERRSPHFPEPSELRLGTWTQTQVNVTEGFKDKHFFERSTNQGAVGGVGGDEPLAHLDTLNLD